MVTASIILLTKNAGPQLNKLLKCIGKQNFEEPFEILAIDSGSHDNTLKTLKEYHVKVIEIDPADFHHSKTRNLGAKNANGEILVFLTQDALPSSENYLKTLINPIKVNEKIAVVYGKQVAYDSAKIMEKFFYQYFYPKKEAYLSKKDVKDIKSFYLENIYISDVCSAIRKDVWEKIRFNNDVFMSEDKDFAINVLKSNYNIFYEPNAKVYHSHDYSLKSLFKRRFKDGMAYSTICIDGSDKFLKKGLKFFKEEIKFIIINKKAHMLPYAFIYNFIYFLGFQMGNYDKKLPSILKNRLLKENHE